MFWPLFIVYMLIDFLIIDPFKDWVKDVIKYYKNKRKDARNNDI